MLSYTKVISINGVSTIDDVQAEGYSATINSENPNETASISSYLINPETRKENREQCRADQAQFEDMVYALQDELIAEAENTDDTTEDTTEDTSDTTEDTTTEED